MEVASSMNILVMRLFVYEKVAHYSNKPFYRKSYF
jgi:hypothetical protein